ncbi:MAG: inorganic phosphate transporter [Pseudomonadota bacterium]|nr:inorganic phosphate transporter [Pseudomonadota bacterium]
MDWILFLLALFSGGFMAWGVGANDVANAMGTSVGSKIITIKQAILIAAVFEGLGAFLGSGVVTGTIRNDIIDLRFYESSALVLAKGMIAALLASASWLLLATQKGWPVSTTHSIVGAVVGFGLVSQGAESVQWDSLIYIASSWVLTPIVSAITAWGIFKIVQRIVLMHPNPVGRAHNFLGICTLIFTFMVIDISFIVQIPESYELLIHLAAAAVLALGAYFLTSPPDIEILSYRQECYKAEKMFGFLALGTACGMAYAHGSNDVANAIGPLASVVEILETGSVKPGVIVPYWVWAYGAVGVVTGLAVFGYKIIASVGSKITTLSPSRSFSAQLATALVVLVASRVGLPVSTTHTLVGSVLGVGLARGLAAVNLNVVREIFMSWLVTIPAGIIFSMVYFYLLEAIL